MSKLTKDNIRFLPPAAKYLKKLKDKKLKKLYQDAIDSILDDPFHSPEKLVILKVYAVMTYIIAIQIMSWLIRFNI